MSQRPAPAVEPARGVSFAPAALHERRPYHVAHIMSDTPHFPAAAPAAATPAVAATVRCANCGTPGTGRFCGHCGQRLDVHLHSVGHFVGEAAEVLTHSDSSLWRTLWPLLARPGHLTREFIAGRRVRYLQPFRLYLVASVLLLVANTVAGGHDTGAASQAQGGASVSAAANEIAGEFAQEAGAGGAGSGAADKREDGKPAAGGARPGNALELKVGNCERITTNAGWMKRFLPALAASCRRIVADNGRELGHAMAQNAARAMFVFLPLLAAFMKLMYWHPRRYYLEHLLLLLHNHAFIYLLFALFVLVTRPLAVDWLESLLGLAMVLYTLRYLYKSMRNYYGQGRALTLSKFVLLAGAYSVAGGVMFALTAFVTAVTL
jgi:hypothetical protein